MQDKRTQADQDRVLLIERKGRERERRREGTS